MFDPRSLLHSSHIGWIVTALTLRGQFHEAKGNDRKAQDYETLAELLSNGLRLVSWDQKGDPALRLEVVQATMTATGGYWLASLGVTDHSANYLPSMAALRWLGSKMKTAK